jgi:hypothetical protein
LGKEEAKSYHLAFPRSIAYFIDGLFIAFMSWVVQKGNGRIVVDPSTPLDKHDRGALNTHIPKPGLPGSLDRKPAHHIRQRVRPTFDPPLEPAHYQPAAGNPSTHGRHRGAFHRIHYHPDLGVCYAYVFEKFLIIPVGMIFGSGDSPSWFGATAEPRTHMGATRDYTSAHLPVADSVQLPPPPTEDDIATFVQATADAEHQGISADFASRYWHAMFVDDNAVADIYDRFTDAVRSAEGSAYDNYGSPDLDPRGPVLPLNKFVLVALTRILHLGMLVDSRLMAVAWPLEKLERLSEMLDDWIGTPRPRTAHEAARLLGLVRHGAQLSNTGPFWSIRLQRQLSAITSSTAAAQMRKKHWWKWKRLKIDPTISRDLAILRRTLPPVDAANPDPFSYWSRPIGLMIPREPNVVALSDASYSGLGGWSPTWQFMWRLTRDNLLASGFDMRKIDKAGEDLLMYEKDCPNVLELVAIIINTWIILKRMQQLEVPVGGWIVSILADDTSALSWFHFAARNHRSIIVQNLTMFCQALISLSHTDHLVRFQGSHIPGVANDEADALSRPTIHPSVASATKAYSRLQTCRFLLLPSGLLSTLGRITSWDSTEAALVNKRTTLLTAELHFLPLGSLPTASAPNYYKRSTRRSSRR